MEKREHELSSRRRSERSEVEEEPLERDGRGINTPNPQQSVKSRQCRGLTAAVPHYDSASLQVRRCRTRQDFKGRNIEDLAVLAEQLRMYVYRI
jgi:hypothetical protein